MENTPENKPKTVIDRWGEHRSRQKNKKIKNKKPWIAPARSVVGSMPIRLQAGHHSISCQLSCMFHILAHPAMVGEREKGTHTPRHSYDVSNRFPCRNPRSAFWTRKQSYSEPLVEACRDGKSRNRAIRT